MHHTIKQKAAFSMLELIFVIVILGIVASIGSELIAKVYESYIVERAQHRGSVKTQIAINQIENFLRNAIPGTVIRRVGLAGAAESLQQAMASAPGTYTVLQWVGSDVESFEAINSNVATGVNRRPGWSGFCDINASTQTSIVSPGSNFTLTNTIQANMGRVGNNFAIYFPNDPVAHFGTGAGNTITLANPAAPIVERYKLAWTSYALVVDANSDLRLYYNFTPTIATPIVGPNQILLKNVRNFKFERRGQTTRIKLCVEEFIDSNVTGTGIPSCKEKVIF